MPAGALNSIVLLQGVQLRAVDNGDGTFTLATTLLDTLTGKLPGQAGASAAPVAPSPISVVESSLGLPALNNVFVDSACVAVAGSKKTIYLVVTTALTWVTSGQATWQPYVGRTSMAAVSGAGTGIDAAHFALGAAVNLGGAAATSLAVGTYRMDIGAVAALQYPDPFVGVELKFPSALTAGVALAFVEASS